MVKVDWNTSIQYLKGVGEKRAQLYKKLGILTVGDLIYHFPRSYIDPTQQKIRRTANSKRYEPV